MNTSMSSSSSSSPVILNTYTDSKWYLHASLYGPEENKDLDTYVCKKCGYIIKTVALDESLYCPCQKDAPGECTVLTNSSRLNYEQSMLLASCPNKSKGCTFKSRVGESFGVLTSHISTCSFNNF